MTSGLDFEETHSGADPVSQMLTLHADMAAYVKRAELKEKPGRRFEYTSGNTMVVARAIRDAVGGSLDAQREFFQRELAVPLGLRHVVFEADASGTLVGCSYVFASPRDWARLGLLYLNEGEVKGRRVLDRDWVAESIRPTEKLSVPAPYGAGFWLNRVEGEDGRLWPSLPEEIYSFRGFQGQYVLIVPSKRLVIVRMGTSRGHESSGMEALARGVIDALDPECSKS
jgi:CubicO group peptidase (beta-lactamase class C family)